MTFNTLAIPVGYTLLVIVLLWFMIGARGWWWLKATFIAGTLLFGLSLATSLDSYLGWPSRELIPRKFLVHSVLVREPNKKDSKDEGVVYIWVTKLPSALDKEDAKEEEFYDPYLKALEYRQEGHLPRSYELPYSDQLRRAGAAVNKRIAQGAVVIGKRGKDGGFGLEGKGKGKGKGKGGTGRMGKEGKNGAFSFSRSDEIYFHELPPPRVPDKFNE